MTRDLREIYSKFLKKKQVLEHQKCKTILKNCKCDYHFKKGEEICPQCKTSRQTCGSWAMQGKEVCRMHGGKAGRPLTRGVHLTSGTFTKAEWEQIEKAMNEKTREHEFVYQIATAAFRKIIDNQEETDERSPIIALQAATEYFSKISKYIRDIDAQEASMVHTHTFDEITKQKLEKRIIKITNQALQNALMLIVGILKRDIKDTTLYEKIYSQFPQIYKDLLDQKMRVLNKA